MSRRFLIFILLTGLGLTVLYAPRPNAPRAASLPNFTIPTRTPIPPPTAVPTDPPPPPPTDPPPGATAVPTNPPAVTATNTPIAATLAASPVGGFLPTAVACGTPPTIQTRGSTRVRSGPGTDYAAIGDLLSREVRPIVGRAGSATWWLITLANGQTAWVSNEVVLVQGYTGDVPIVDAPPINGQTPTPGAIWQPTAVPGCPTSTATPLPPTATQPPTPSTTPTAVPPTAVPPTIEPTTNPLGAAAVAATATSVVPAGAATISALDSSAEPTAAATAAPLDDVGSAGSAVLPCASAMIGMAVVGFLIGRRFW
ncbi:MAG: SH3 domain-containing protein [Chloroflexi bacterium]|nr:SH3 domain-containing protein [Chloroflexota bacterium]